MSNGLEPIAKRSIECRGLDYLVLEVTEKNDVIHGGVGDLRKARLLYIKLYIKPFLTLYLLYITLYLKPNPPTLGQA